MLTKFDIGQHVSFWYSKVTTVPGTICHIEINKDNEVSYSILWDKNNSTTMGIPEDDVFLTN